MPIVLTLAQVPASLLQPEWPAAADAPPTASRSIGMLLTASTPPPPASGAACRTSEQEGEELAAAGLVPCADVPPKTTVSGTTNRRRRATSVGRGDNEVAARHRRALGTKPAAGTQLQAPPHSDTTVGRARSTPATAAGSNVIPREKRTRCEPQIPIGGVRNQLPSPPIRWGSTASLRPGLRPSKVRRAAAGPVISRAAMGSKFDGEQLDSERGRALAPGRPWDLAPPPVPPS